MGRIAIIIGVLSVLLLSSARADYHYASHEGTSEYPYTSWATAADSVQKAIDAASAGDTIYVGSGVWEDIPYTLRDSCALIGMGIDSTIIRKEGRVDFLYTNNHVRIENFTFDGIDRTSNGVAIYNIYDNVNVIITHNKFIHIHEGFFGVITGALVNNLFNDLDIAFDATWSACSLLVKNNTITNCHQAGILAYNGFWHVERNIFHHNPGTLSMLMLNFHQTQDTAYVANNLFYNNQYSSPNVHAATLWLVGEGAINNTFIGPDDISDQSAIGISDNGDAYTTFSQNNTISHFYAAFFIFQYYQRIQLDVSYTNIWDVEYDHVYSPVDYNYLEGNLRVDPMFADTTSFQLQAYSPLIDAGDPSILDVDGTRSDIGCYGGPGGLSYEYLDLAPAVPETLMANIAEDSIIIAWNFNTEADFSHYFLWRDTLAGFEPSVFNLIAEPETCLYVDRDFDYDHNYYYRVAAADLQNNVSNYSAELAVILTDITDLWDSNLPRVNKITNNYPNPFNAQTKINFYLADVGYQPASVQMYIYDVMGRLVRKLIDERRYPGEYSVIWDGRADDGSAVTSGVYFVRLIVSDLELVKPKKIILIR